MRLSFSTFLMAGLFAGAVLGTLPNSVGAAGAAGMPGICARPCWGARAPGAISYMSSLTRAIVHHTAGNEFNTTGYEGSKANVRAIQNYHMNTNGWSDIGYHFLVDKFGHIFEGRHGSIPGLPRGAHDGTNSNSFGFNLMGYFHPGVNNVPTIPMMNALYDVIAWKMPNGWTPYGSPGVYGPLGRNVGRVDGHRNVKATACPGDHVHNPYIGNNVNVGVIRDEIDWRIRGMVGGAIRARYTALGGCSAFGLGRPLIFETATPDGIGRYNHFSSGGSIYWTPSTGAWEVHGSIRARWESLGWETGICGYPITGENVCPDGIGRYNHFSSNNASIYWTPSTGAWEVHGAIKSKWANLGWENSVVGYPTTNEMTCPDGIGKYNHFRRLDGTTGSIYFTPATGAWEVHGSIRDHWASLGWENSSLGYPTSDEYAIAGGRRSNFQNGTITWNSNTGQVTVP